MPLPITSENWQTIRSNFRHGFATNLHVAVATVDAEEQPHVTPIGSFFLNRDKFSGFYFEIFTRNIPKNAVTNPKVCIMAVNSGRWYWLKSLVLGKFATPPSEIGKVNLHRWAAFFDDGSLEFYTIALAEVGNHG